MMYSAFQQNLYPWPLAQSRGIVYCTLVGRRQLDKSVWHKTSKNAFRSFPETKRNEKMTMMRMIKKLSNTKRKIRITNFLFLNVLIMFQLSYSKSDYLLERSYKMCKTREQSRHNSASFSK